MRCGSWRLSARRPVPTAPPARAHDLARRFEAVYWNETAGCLYDVVPAARHDWAGASTQPQAPDASIRPNQIFALSLPFPLLSPGRARRVLDVVESKLMTPVGLRSLDPEHPDYRPRYEGDVWARDTAYHQGTVWSWLLGPFFTALVRVRSDAGRVRAQGLWDRAVAHLEEGLVGSVAEIFDAEPPHVPRGAAAQAWGVAELLRAYHEDLVPSGVVAHA
jgi:glycogen debranching enzyme